MNTPTKRVFITVQGGVAYNDEDKSDPEVTVLVLDFDNDPGCAICEARIKEGDEWAFSDAHNDFVHADCLRGEHGGMTDKEYVAKKGLHCPFCGSTHIEAENNIEPDDADALSAHSYVECLDCEKAWRDVYTITGYTRLLDFSQPRHPTLLRWRGSTHFKENHMEPLTPTQLQNWRSVLAMGPVGPFAFLITDQGIQDIRNALQAQLEANTYTKEKALAALAADGHLVYYRPDRMWVMLDENGENLFSLTPQEATELLRSTPALKRWAQLDLANIYKLNQGATP